MYVYETPSKCPQRMRLKRFTYPDRTLQVDIEKGYNKVHLFCRITMSKEVHRQFASICRSGVFINAELFNRFPELRNPGTVFRPFNRITYHIYRNFNQCFSSIFQFISCTGVIVIQALTHRLNECCGFFGQSIL